MASPPAISVVIPVYNGEAFLAESLRSVLAQTLPAAQVLVFDNGSTDATRTIALGLLPEEDVRSFERNDGAIVNFNRSMRATSGELVAWLAADDRLAPTHLERCAAALSADPHAAACLPGIRYIDLDGAPVRDHVDRDLASPEPGVRLRSFLRRGRWTEFYCLYRRDVLLASPLVSNDYGADVVLTWWFLLRGHLAVVDAPLLEYRTYPTKSVAELAHTLDPHAPAMHWRKVRLWRRLRAMTREAGVEPHVASIARRELALCFMHPAWIGHLVEDLMQRWPRMTAPLRPLTARVRHRRQVGPSTDSSVDDPLVG